MNTWVKAVLLGGIIVWTLCALGLDAWGKTQRPSGTYDAIVVAGCRVGPDGLPSPALEWRVRLAVALWHEGWAPRVVFTGGVGTFPPAEAVASATLARTLGLPEAATHIEDRSTSTEENARNAALTLNVQRVLVVTDAYHVFRARRLFDRHFEEVDAVGSTYGVVSRVRGAYREVLAVLKFAALSTI